MPGVAANVHTITINDANMRPIGSVADWLDDNDPLDAATRIYLQARLDAANAAPKRGAKPWEAAARTRARDEANKRAVEARQRAMAILEERGILPR